MRDLLLFIVTAWLAMAAGRNVLHLLRLGEGPTRLERNILGFALGLGLLAYGMLALGLAGGLYPLAGLGLLLVLALTGARQHAPMARELWQMFRAGVPLSPWGWLAVFLFFLLALVSLIGVWTPPTASLEWDSLAYHLADPKMYLQAHRIYFLPWESHSNFAFTAEMWYLFGLMESGVPLAKLFHFTCGLGACLAVYAFGARRLSPKVGLLAAGVLASTPLVLWEAGTAYVDLAGMFFATLTLLAVATGMAERDERWLWLAAILMGLTLSTKATALTTLALLALGLIYWRVWCQKQAFMPALRATVLWCGLALAVGSPWFLKSIVYTGNPIYPFYYQIFGGRYFNASLAKIYDQSNANFGVTYDTKTVDTSAVRTPAMAALAPWNLTMYLLPYRQPPNPAFRPFNDVQLPLIALSPLFLAALFFPVFGRSAPGTVKFLGLYVLGSGFFWIVTSQQIRYLLPALPVFCLLTAWVVVRAIQERWRSGVALAGMAGASLVFTLYTAYGPSGLVSREAPVAFGIQTKNDYLRRDLSGYAAMQFINRHLPSNAKIVFYGHPFGFYCDKPYLWGDAQHSTVIPYDTFHGAADLQAHLQKLHVTHILMDRQFFKRTPEPTDYKRWVFELTEDAGPPVFEANGVAVYALPGTQP